MTSYKTRENNVKFPGNVGLGRAFTLAWMVLQDVEQQKIRIDDDNINTLAADN